MPAERFHVGWRIEDTLFSDDPSCHANWPDAKDALVDLMFHIAETDDEQALEEVDWSQVDDAHAWFDSDEAPAMVATVVSILHDDPPVEPEGYNASIEDHRYRRIGFFLTKVMCQDPLHLRGTGQGRR